MRINALPKVCCSQGVIRFRENLHSLCDPAAAGQGKDDRGVVPGKNGPMGVLLALVSAVCYGTSDFVAGVGGRRGMPSAVTMIAQPFGLLAALAAVALLPSPTQTSPTLWWGALSGLGSGVGTIALYRGLARGQMVAVSVVRRRR